MTTDLLKGERWYLLWWKCVVIIMCMHRQAVDAAQDPISDEKVKNKVLSIFTQE